jgi:heme exporter protein A
MPAARNALIHADALCFSRNAERIFGPIDFSLHAGEALLLKGGNGAGKTTFLRVLAGLLPAESGRVFIQGQSFTNNGFVNLAAYLGHKHGHKAELTVLQNLQFSSSLRPASQNQPLQAVLRDAGLAGYDDTPAGQLSAGQNKRLSLARLLVQGAPLWLLDEPYANLDLAGIDWVNDLLQKHLAGGGAALISTHGAYAAPFASVRTLHLHKEQAHA